MAVDRKSASVLHTHKQSKEHDDSMKCTPPSIAINAAKGYSNRNQNSDTAIVRYTIKYEQCVMQTNELKTFLNVWYDVIRSKISFALNRMGLSIFVDEVSKPAYNMFDFGWV